jgi:arsenic resistance protein ArsH
MATLTKNRCTMLLLLLQVLLRSTITQCFVPTISIGNRNSGSKTISNQPPIAATTNAENENNDENNLWNYDDPDGFSGLSHPGYAVESDPDSHTGGWLPHRKKSLESPDAPCWIQDEVVDKITSLNYAQLPIGRPPRLLILYGSLRETSFSRKLGLEFARLFEVLGCDVRVYNPRGLPVRDPTLENSSIKVQELRALTQWSDGHVWISPEMHGTLTGAFKNQIDWIPLNTGSVRPTQGRTCLVAQINGGSQSFNAVNAMRVLARWMRMPCCTNQSSIAKAWKEFETDDNEDGSGGRMKASDFRDRVVDCAEEMAKFTAIMAAASGDLNNRYSERKETEEKGRLLTQAEKEAAKDSSSTTKKT